MRVNGRVYEALAARLARRPARDLYHSALEVRTGTDRHVVEVTPVVGSAPAGRGVVGEGPVGARWAGRLRIFRYEIRRWSGGLIPDVDEAVGGPRRVSDDAACARRVLDLVPEVPRHVWGRDPIGAGDMWNSNSVISWLLVRGGIDAAAIAPPAGGRAPGWQAGLVVAGARPGPR